MNNCIIVGSGLAELTAAINQVVQKYPDEAETILTKTANKFRKSVQARTPQSKTNRKRKLIKSYKVEKPTGYGTSLSVDFRSTAPHYHLVERGHRIAKGGRVSKKNGGTGSSKNTGMFTGGKVAGRYMVETTIKEYQEEFPKEVEKMLDKFIQKIEG